MKQSFTIGVFAILRDEIDKILLVLRNDYELWNLPGGGLEKGESPWQGVVREIKEETGFDAEVVKLVGVYSKPEKNDLVFSFECRIVGGKLVLGKESKDIKYFTLNELPKNIVQKQLERIKDFLRNKNEVIMKVQKGKSSIQLYKEGKLRKK